MGKKFVKVAPRAIAPRPIEPMIPMIMPSFLPSPTTFLPTTIPETTTKKSNKKKRALEPEAQQANYIAAPGIQPNFAGVPLMFPMMDQMMLQSQLIQQSQQIMQL